MNCFEANLSHRANQSIYTSCRRYNFLQITISWSWHNINSNVNGLLILYNTRPTALLQTSWLLQLLTLYSSYNEYLHNWPWAPAILAVLWPHFSLEPPYRGPCKGVNIRYFFNVSSMFWEPFIYGGCDAKENNILRAADCRRTCGGSLGHWGKTGGRQGDGSAGIRAQGGTQNLRTSQCSTSPPRSPGEVAAVSGETTHWACLPGASLAEGHCYKPHHDNLSLLTCSPFSDGNTESAPHGAGPQC